MLLREWGRTPALAVLLWEVLSGLAPAPVLLVVVVAVSRFQATPFVLGRPGSGGVQAPLLAGR